jgi:hypothetical protein
MLRGGLRYFFEALMLQTDGDDHLAIRWTTPNGMEEPIPAQTAEGPRLIPFTGRETPPGIWLQPQSATMRDGEPVTFRILVTNQARLTYQWRANDTNLPWSGATSPALVIPDATKAMNNLALSCVISNSLGATTSAPVVLTVISDEIAPTVVRAIHRSTTDVEVIFSEPVLASSATNVLNYICSDGVQVVGAALQQGQTNVVLRTSPMIQGETYVLTINGVTDLARVPNVIAPDTGCQSSPPPHRRGHRGSSSGNDCACSGRL